MNMDVLVMITLGLLAVLMLAVAVKVWRRGDPEWVSQLRADLAQAQAKLARAESDLRTAENEKNRLQGAEALLQASIAEKNDAIARLDARLEAAAGTLRTTTISLQSAEDALRRAEDDLANALADRDAAVADRKAAETARDTAERKVTNQDIQIRSLETTNQQLFDDLKQARLDLSNAEKAANEARLKQQAAENNVDTTNRKLAEIQTFVEGAKEKLTLSFMDLAKQAFAERSEALDTSIKETTTRNKAEIDALLKPLQDRLDEFKRRVDEVHTEETKSISSLLGQVTKLEQLNQRMSESTESLTKALKGSAKVRGDWGELALDTVLEASGLIEGQHYERQVAVTTEVGGQRRPDVVVRLPGDRRIVIDSKALLLNWQAAVNTDAPDEQRALLKAHAAALRNHVDDLGKKDYPSLVGGDALEFTIAFIPVEGALSGAIAVDPGLQVDAFAKRVALATPNTLIAMLSLCGRIWQREQVQREAEEISSVGGKLLQSIENFMGSFDKVGKSLESATAAHREARHQLTDSTQSVSARAKKLEALGLKLQRPTRVARKTKSALASAEDAPARPFDDLYAEPTIDEIMASGGEGNP